MAREAWGRSPRLPSLAFTMAVCAVVTTLGCAPRSTASASAPVLQSAPAPPVAGAARPAAAPPAAGPRLAPGDTSRLVEAARLERLVARNLGPRVSLPESLLSAHLAAWESLGVGSRIARWAQLFASRRDNTYCFGPKPGGYVAESLLVQDRKFDCVLLFYRCTELARATSPRDAVLLALTTRFAGGDPARVVSPAGGVDYDDPSHLDYSEDFAATGLWGRDVTREVGLAVPDSVGTSRYPAGSRWFIPTRRLRDDRLQEGDLLFFVLDERHPGAAKLRAQFGLLVGHQGIVHVEGGEVLLLHAAQSDLQGVYTGNRVVAVPLRTYLERMERFKGILVNRIEGEGLPPSKP